MLREFKREDVRRVVDVHGDSFSGFFLTSLGPRFLSLYYSGVARSRDHIGFVYVDSEGCVQGFVVGSSNPRGFYSRLLKRDWYKFALASLGLVFRRPRVISRITRAVSHPKRNPVGDDVAGLFSVGVSPVAQGTGAGKMMVEAFLEEAARRGCKSVCLTTDRDENEAVNGFYSRLGFHVKNQFDTPEGRRMNEYWKSLSAS